MEIRRLNVLIIGLGSIARKHISALREIRPEVTIYALRSQTSDTSEDGIFNIFTEDDVPEIIDFTIISNPTSQHLKAIQGAVKLNKPIFLEKPPVSSVQEVDDLREISKGFDHFIYVGYNMRFHPAVKWAKENIELSEVLEVQAYCGSYLPDWRKNTDYRKTYSASAKLGGGVHLDLIHELDYVNYIFGVPESSNKYFSRVSDLEIDSVDSAHYWLEYQNFNISITLNYFRIQPKRTIEVVLKNDIFTIDLINSTVTNKKGKVIFQGSVDDIKNTYLDQMQFFLQALSTGDPNDSNLPSALNLMELCL